MIEQKFPTMEPDMLAAVESMLGKDRAHVVSEIEKLDAVWSCSPSLGTPLYGRDAVDEPFRGWSIPRIEAIYLYSLVRFLKPKVGVEIGTSFGYSTIWLASAMQGSGGHLHTCEVVSEKVEMARRFLDRASASNVTLHNCEAQNLCRSWSQPIDLLFMDADAENYMTYWQHLLPHFQANTLVVVDNALDRALQLRPFMDKLSSDAGLDCWTAPIGHGILHIQSNLAGRTP